MLLQDFYYFLPKELIAQKPIQPRDHSRLMILNRQEQTISHDYFYNLGKYLRPSDILVANNSKVIPARLLGRKSTGGQIEIFLLRQINDNDWQVLIKNCKLGDRVVFQKKSFLATRSLGAEIIKQNTDRTWEARFSLGGEGLLRAINHLGQTPTPPYIKHRARAADYQTVYARVNGSVAAPTAG
ncbi:MAG: S-adenosylmethionine:tRNA ribosyltransferase-isomerase, partial [Candidatus Parcubacteria bacterium]|nr:S-adenosylmethionine:tRNA ribosyltransferase-isomerase [Candidatus Parcubacteria bacterium]